MKIKTMRRRFVIAISLGMILFGVIAYAATTVILAVGTIPHSEIFDGPATVTVRTLTIKPGEVLAWHYHPGYAFNVVKSGTLTVEEGCGGEETLTPGQAFEELDGHVHRAKNLSATEDVVVYNTFIVPQGKPTTVNIPNNERRCGPPSDVSECKDYGWLKYTQPRNFTSQGDCVDFVRHRARVVLLVPDAPPKPSCQDGNGDCQSGPSSSN
jgi:quercetin dioxygenase-like cupin family protein